MIIRNEEFSHRVTLLLHLDQILPVVAGMQLTEDSVSLWEKAPVDT